MRIYITYESTWRNSFLDGSNNEPLPQKGRKFIASMTELKKPGNYLQRTITKDTVMGVLNRLIGEQAKLYQARQRDNYYFSEIESKLKNSDIVDKPSITNEVVYIRNMTGSTDQKSFVGMLNLNDPWLQGKYATNFWNIIWLEPEELLGYLLNDKLIIKELENKIEPFAIAARFDELRNQYLEKTNRLIDALDLLSKKFSNFKIKERNERINSEALYCSALYLQFEKMPEEYREQIRASRGGLVGISHNNFTYKNFIARFTGGEKPVWGGAYLKKEKMKGQGEVVTVLNKAGGELIINLDIPRDKAIDLEEKIENAGVSSFYLGKKGLAYVTDIRV